MRLLIVHPNTSPGVTARIDAAAQAIAAPGDHLTTVSAASGPALIVTEKDGEAATLGVLSAISAHDAPVDGIVLASFGDTGAAEVRVRYPGGPGCRHRRGRLFGSQTHRRLVRHRDLRPRGRRAAGSEGRGIWLGTRFDAGCCASTALGA